MKLSIKHESFYRYERSVSLSPHLLYVRPRQNSSQRLRQFKITVSSGAVLSNVIDPLDNDFIHAWFPKNTDLIHVQTSCEVESLNVNPFNFLLSGEATRLPFAYAASVAEPLAPYRIPLAPATRDTINSWLAREFGQAPKATTDFLGNLIQLIFKKIGYQRREELGFQTSIETLRKNSGTCRDFAVLFVEICRELGLAARFVSGYLYTPADKPDLAGNSMHAWTEVYLPGAGWKGLDPTAGVWCDDSYIPVAHGARAQAVNPIQGSYYSDHPVSSKLESTVDVSLIAP